MPEGKCVGRSHRSGGAPRAGRRFAGTSPRPCGRAGKEEAAADSRPAETET